MGDFGVSGIKTSNVKTDERKALAVDGVFVAIGNIPNTGLVKNKIETNEAGYIITDENMQTNIFDVFGAGDVSPSFVSPSPKTP